MNSPLLQSLASRSGGLFIDLNYVEMDIIPSILSAGTRFSFLGASCDEFSPLAPVAITENRFVLVTKFASLPTRELSITLHFGTSFRDAIPITCTFAVPSECRGTLVPKYWASKKVKDVESMAVHSPFHRKMMLDIGKKFR